MAYITNEIKTVTGTDITINDSDQKNIVDLQIQGDATQSGTPTPSSPIAVQTVTGNQNITVCGKNFYNKDIFIQGTWQSSSPANRIVGFLIPTKTGQKYTVSLRNNELDFAIGNTTKNEQSGNTTVQEDSGWQSGNYTYTITGDGYLFLQVKKRYGGNLTPSDLSATDFQVELGETSTTYEAYNGTTYGINLGKNLWNEDYTNISTGIKYKPIYVGDGTFTMSSNIPQSSSGNSLFFLTGNVSSGASSSTNGVDASISRTITSTNGYVTIGYRGGGNFIDPSGYKTQLEKGSIATTYTPYKTPIQLLSIPNTDYKDNIYKLKHDSKNLFDKENVNVLNAYIEEGQTTIISNANSRTIYLECKPNTTYYISKINTNRFRVGNTTVTPVVSGSVSNITQSDSGDSITYTTSNNANYIVMFVWNASASSNYATYQEVLDTLMVAESSTALSYEPYGALKGTWLIEKQIGKVVLDGTQTITRRDTGTTGYYRFDINIGNNIFSTDNASAVAPIYCDRLLGKARTNTWDRVEGIAPTTTGYAYKTFDLYISAISQMTTTQANTWFSNNNTIVYYPYKTPLISEITDTELINQLNAIELKEKLNNIVVSSRDLGSPIKLSYYSTNNDYCNAVYSQDDRNDLKIWFNDVELENAPIKCEKITRTARILPNDGNKVFSLDNFISTSLEVILHDVDIDDIQDQVKISIGTLIDAQNNTYQYIPLGVFNIQDTPTNDNGKITLKLRDNRVKFDFNYNAQPLIEANGGTASKKQILNDICSQAGVTNTIYSFNGQDDLVGIYDNTITATTYISYLMEQAGLIPVIDRDGNLKAIDLSKPYVWKIPLSILETGFEIGEPYKIERVVYESGVIKYETSSDETLDTLYINSANPYISNQYQVDYILEKLQNFIIDSVTTKNVLGNPAIDPYDIIRIYNDLDNSNDIIFETLANTTYTYNGKHRDKFETQISKEQRTENVSLNGEATFRRYARTNIDNINGEITLVVGETNANTTNIDTLSQIVDDQGNQIDALGTRITQNVNSITASITGIQEELENGVGKVKTTSVTIDNSGLNVSTDTSKISTQITNNAFEIKDSGNNTIAYFGYDETEGISKAEMDNLTVTNYFVAGVHRVETYEDNGEERTGWFYIGG